MPYSGDYEIEIRVNTVVAVEKIMDKIKESTVQPLKDHIKYAFQVDWLLW
jgi:hypothetical protein